MVEKMSERRSGQSFGAGVLVGVVVGAIIGILLAPRSGKETRDIMKDKADDVSASVKDFTADRRKVYTETWKNRGGRPKMKPSYFE